MQPWPHKRCYLRRASVKKQLICLNVKLYLLQCIISVSAINEPLNFRTEVLIFTGNTIPTLPINLFNKTEFFDDLVTIDLSSNHIRFIQGKTFHRVSLKHSYDTVLMLKVTHKFQGSTTVKHNQEVVLCQGSVIFFFFFNFVL